MILLMPTVESRERMAYMVGTFMMLMLFMLMVVLTRASTADVRALDAL